jgi:hypothetical protein
MTANVQDESVLALFNVFAILHSYKSSSQYISFLGVKYEITW